jgi:hypothetical protein
MTDKIFGHDWRDIQRAQQGGQLNARVDTSRPVDHTPTAADLEALAAHGADGLRALQFLGTLDRLQRAGLIPSNQEP